MDGGERTEITRIVEKCCTAVSALLQEAGKVSSSNWFSWQPCSVEQETSVNGWRKPQIIEISQPRVVRDRHKALHSALRSWAGAMMESLQKWLRNIHLYNFERENILKMDALKTYEVLRAGLSKLRSKLDASTRAVLHLQLPTVPERSKTILDDDSDVAGEVELLRNKLIDSFVYKNHVTSMRLCLRTTEKD